MSQSRNQQVQPSVAVEVCEYRSGTDVIRGIQAGLERCVFKSPPTKVPIERVLSPQTAQKNVRSSVSIEVTHGCAASVLQNTVGCTRPLVQDVREADSCLPG